MTFRLTLPILLLAFSPLLAAVDLNRPLSELKLEDGRTLKNVTFVSYASSAIMAKWDGGRGTIAYDLLPKDVAGAAEKMRPRSSAPPPPRPTPAIPSAPPKASTNASAPASAREMSGQVFVTTRGAGAYKFAGAVVYVYPAVIYEMAVSSQRVNYSPVHPLELQQALAWRKALEGHEPVAAARTDAEGSYKLNLPPSGEFFLYCETSRQVGKAQEYNVWVVKASAGRTDLNLGNQWEQPR